MPAVKTRSSQGKTAFVKEYLLDNPDANSEAVNEAWSAEGMEGTISTSLVKITRSKLGLTKKRGRRPKSASVSAKKAKVSRASSNGVAESAMTFSAPTAAPVGVRERGRVMAELESELDRLIFKLMSVGGLTGIEEALRGVRRQVILGHKS